MVTTKADPKSRVMFADTKAGTFQAKTFLEKDHSTVQVVSGCLLFFVSYVMENFQNKGKVGKSLCFQSCVIMV